MRRRLGHDVRRDTDAPLVESAADVRAFFERIDEAAGERAPEPDWRIHRLILEASRIDGLASSD